MTPHGPAQRKKNGVGAWTKNGLKETGALNALGHNTKTKKEEEESLGAAAMRSQPRWTNTQKKVQAGKIWRQFLSPVAASSDPS